MLGPSLRMWKKLEYPLGLSATMSPININIDYSDYPKSLIGRITEVMYFSIRYSYIA